MYYIVLHLHFYMYYIVARQMWRLRTYLPLIVGSSIPSDYEKWHHFLLLLKHIQQVFSSVASVDGLGVLEGYNEDF